MLNLGEALAGGTVSVLDDAGGWIEIGVVDEFHFPEIEDKPEPPFIVVPINISFEVPMHILDGDAQRLRRRLRRLMYGPPTPPLDGWYREFEPAQQDGRTDNQARTTPRLRRRQQHDMAQASQQKRRMFVQALRAIG